MKRPLFLLVVSFAALSVPLGAQEGAAPFDTARHFELVDATIPELQQALQTHSINSKRLVKLYLDRVEAYEGLLNATIIINPDAIAQAHRLDVERAKGRIRGPLHGIPIALKDNIHTTDMPTTGGALAFSSLVPPYEATLVRKLREAGAVIIGKTVLTELANWVAQAMPANYSAVGGFGFNPYDPRPDPRTVPPFNDGRPVLSTGGSSSGIGTSASFWPANVGTETSGSILSPSNQTMLAGVKPTVGRISRHGVIPITADQDTAGPMGPDVASVAIMLGVLEGPDPNDPATSACAPGGDYTKHLKRDALTGARVGIPRANYYAQVTTPTGRRVGGLAPDQAALMEEAIEVLRDAGAIVVDPADIPSVVDTSAANNLLEWGICAAASQGKGFDSNCSVVLKFGFKRDFNAWLDSLGPATDIDTLTELREFNLAHAAGGAIKYAQARLDISDEMVATDAADVARYEADRAKDLFLTAEHGIDEVMDANGLDALLFPAARGADVAARPGYPTVTVPFGFVQNTAAPPFPEGFVAKPAPFGVSFTGKACSEPRLIELAYAFEQAGRRAGFGRVAPESAPPLPKDSKGKTK